MQIWPDGWVGKQYFWDTSKLVTAPPNSDSLRVKPSDPPPPPTPNLSEQGVIRENTKVKKLRIDKALLDKSWNVF